MKLFKISETSILIELKTVPNGIAKTVREAFSQLGMPVQEEIEVVCFSGNGGVLLFATQTRPACVVYRFETVEDLIGGAQAVTNENTVPTTLFCSENAYFLVLPYENIRLSEFGTMVQNPEETKTYLQEYGTILCEENAIEKLAHIFHT